MKKLFTITFGLALLMVAGNVQAQSKMTEEQKEEANLRKDSKDSNEEEDTSFTEVSLYI